MLSKTWAFQCLTWLVVLVVPPVQEPTIHDDQPKRSTNQDADSSTLPNPSPLKIPESVISEINEIRARLGGGVASRLKGLLNDNDSPLSDVDEAMSIPSPQRDPVPPLQADFDQHLRTLLGKSLSRDLPAGTAVLSREQASQKQPGPESPFVVDRLRIAARHLDLAAAELEEVRQYRVADEMRDRAQKLRLQARFEKRR